MAVKKIEIIYDINGKAIDVAIDKTLNLKQAARELTKELNKTKEGSDEFKLLASRLNDTKDGLDRVSAKSRDLFAAFSLLPGPVGQFFGQLNGVIGLMKTFTSFSLNDIGNQFKEFGNDLKDIYSNLFGTKKAFDENISSIENTTDAQIENTDSIDEGTQATNAGTAATLKNGQSIKEQSIEIKKFTGNLDNFTAVQNKLTAAGYDFQIQSKKMGDGITITGAKITDLEGNVKNYTLAQLGSINATKDLTDSIGVENDAFKQLDTAITTSSKKMYGATIAGRLLGQTMEFVGFSFNAATVAVGIFETALMAIGIGLIIAAFVAMFEIVKDLTVGFYEWATGIKAAKKELDIINNSIEKTNELLDLDQKSLKNRQNEYVAYLKSIGASEGKIRVQQTKDLKDQLKLVEAATTAIGAEENRLMKNSQATTEDIKKIQKRRGELEQQGKDLRSQIRVSEYNNITETNREIQAANDKAEALRQKKADERQRKLEEENRKKEEENRRHLEKIRQDNETADAELLKLQQENKVLYTKDLRDRQYLELKIQAENEAAKINKLEITETRKEEIRLQIFKKYGAKMIELAGKFNKEDEEKVKENADKRLEYIKKSYDLEVQAIADTTEREKTEKKKKYAEDEKDLKSALEKKYLTQEQYDAAIKNLAIILARDLQKIDDDKTKADYDAMIKKLDDELKFLEIKKSAMIEGLPEFYDVQREILTKAQERELAELNLTEDQKTQIKKKYAKLRQDIDNQEFLNYVQLVSKGLDAFKGVADAALAINDANQTEELEDAKKSIKNKEELEKEQDKIKEKYFYKNKAAQKAQAYINTFQAAVSAYAAMAAIPVVGPVLGAIAAAAAIVAGLANVRKIDAQTYTSSIGDSGGAGAKPPLPNYGKNYGDGGMIEGPRHAGGGVMINAEGGEAVMTRGAVTMFAPLLSAMNMAGGGTSFSKGASGQANFDNPKNINTNTEQNPMIVKTYVVSNDLTNEQQKQARLKNLSTL